MIDIDRELRTTDSGARMLLQVHDELLFETPRAEADATLAMLREKMEGAAELRVPLRVETGTGENWLECK
jgi:DNA polymerase-1